MGTLTVSPRSAASHAKIGCRGGSRGSGAGSPHSEDRCLKYLAALESDEQLHFGPIEWVDLGSWHAGRVVLIGDAAHAAPPHMGEGGSLAIEDVMVLAEVLRDGDTVEHALDVYIARRRPRVGWVQEQSRAAARAWVLPPDMRDAGLRDRGDQMLQDRYRPLDRDAVMLPASK